jgi:putative nucleotidyltransferase with HDIG domain
LKTQLFRKRQKGIAERKTETRRQKNVPYKALGLGLLLWLFATWLFFGHGIIRQIALVQGQHAPSTIVAAVDFECENLQQTAFQRNKAAGEVPPVFTIDPAPAQRATKVVEALFDRLGEYATATTNEYQVILNSMNDVLLGSTVKAQELIVAFPSNTVTATKRLLINGIGDIMHTGVLSEEYRMTLFRDAPERKLTIRNDESSASRTVSQQDVFSIRRAIRSTYSLLPTVEQRRLFEKLLPMLITSNMTYNEAATEDLQKKSMEAVGPVIQQYAAGTTLVRAGDQATQQIILLLQHHEQKRLEEQELIEQALEIIGNGVLLLAGLIASAIILRIVAPKLIHQPDKLLLMVILSLSTLGVARLLTYLSVQYSLISPALLIYLVPHALAVLLTAILLGGSAAICLGLWTSFATAVLFDQNFNVFAFGILITITATTTARNVHRRSNLFKAGLWVCIAKMLFVFVEAILNRPAGPVLAGQVFAAVTAGIFSTVLTLLLLPLLEKIFKITTDITLLELSDMGHPLLQKMAIQAPGTYHHSLMVATLAQNAAEAIGANPLLVRVCAYYHDIGKMAKPEFFTENIQHKENPHDELSPHMSALVISSHVKEGLTLAKRHKLPQPILDAIEQHHGNGLISYFFHKAKTQQAEETGNGGTEKINDSDFRYGGAPAVTPEMAILSLADASEAASRSIEKPTPQKITNLMNDIFATKIRDGQMDFADLTMAQINIVKQSFIFSLSNMLHGRIPYPKDHENTNSQSSDKPSDSETTTPKAG